MAEENDQSSTLELATDLAIAWLSNPNTKSSADEVPAFLQKVYGALSSLGSGTGADKVSDEPEYTPAVSVRKSLASKEHIISMIDGKPYKTLRRHLSTHGMTPEQYRERYGLKADYPGVRELLAGSPGYGEEDRAWPEAGREPGARKGAASAPRSARKPKAG